MLINFLFKMKIAINFENLPKDGGAFHENILLTDVFKDFDKNKYEIFYIVSNKQTEKILTDRDLKTIFFKKNLIFRIQNFLYKFPFFKFLLNKLKVQNTFEKFIQKNNVDLVIFNNPSEMSLMAFNLIYVIVFYELQHLQYNFFPEYKSYHNYDLREMVIKNFLQYAFKIITCVEKDKILLQKYYNALEDKIIVQPFVSRLPIIYEKKKEELNFNNFFKKFEKTNKKILFYPAQFWPHKNHRYIIEAIESIVNKNKITDFHVVFCGFDKFHQLDFLKKIIKEKEISDYFSFYDYLEDEEIISLYLNSYALVMPTFVGHYSLPLFEAFYFKIPVFFTKNLLDENLRKYVFEIDTREPKLFYDKLKYLDENKDKVKDLTLSSHEFYKDFCSLKNIKKNYIKIFEDVEYFNNLWK